jgi:hypothetical protein
MASSCNSSNSKHIIQKKAKSDQLESKNGEAQLNFGRFDFIFNTHPEFVYDYDSYEVTMTQKDKHLADLRQSIILCPLVAEANNFIEWAQIIRGILREMKMENILDKELPLLTFTPERFITKSIHVLGAAYFARDLMLSNMEPDLRTQHFDASPYKIFWSLKKRFLPGTQGEDKNRCPNIHCKPGIFDEQTGNWIGWCKQCIP